MWRTWLIASVLLLGGCVPYQSVSGKIYPPGREGAEAALVESGSINLHCAPSDIRARHALMGHRPRGRHGSSMFIAEGCGQRATYVEDCSRDLDEVVCELILVSKVPLD